MKTRKGLDDDHLTYLDAGRIAQESGFAAIALHGRTVAQAYSGEADWDAIAALVDHVDIPVLGNGDIWEAADALRMVEQTGAAGVVVGRGCLGRPWLFRDLAAAFAGDQVATLPDAGRGGRDDAPPRRAARASTWARSAAARSSASTSPGTSRASPPGARCGTRWRWSSLPDLERLLAELDPDEPFPVAELGAPRGRQGSPRQRVVLPEGWLDDTDGTRRPDMREDATETTGG